MVKISIKSEKFLIVSPHCKFPIVQVHSALCKSACFGKAFNENQLPFVELSPKVSLLLKSFWISMESFQGKAAFFHRTFRELSTKVSLRVFNESQPDFGELSKKSQSAFGELSAQVSLLSESFQKSASPRYQVWGEGGPWF